MGVGIDKTGKNAAAVGIENLVGLAESTPMFAFFTNEGDPTILAADYGLWVHRQSGQLRPAPRAIPGWCDNLVGAANEEAHPPFSVFSAAGLRKVAS